MWGLLFLTEIYELELIVAMHYDCYDIAVGGTLTCVIIYRRSAAWTDREQSVAFKSIAPVSTVNYLYINSVIFYP
jgi:hypothetical protein